MSQPRDFAPRVQPQRLAAKARCATCSDSGLVFLDQGLIVGITQLLARSMPCVCPAGDWVREQFEAEAV